MERCRPRFGPGRPLQRLARWRCARGSPPVATGAAVVLWLAARCLLAQIPATEPKGGILPDFVPPLFLPATAAACQFATACGAHATGSFLPTPNPDCLGRFQLRGQTYTSQIDRYSFQGTAGQGLMVVLQTTQLSDPVLALVRVSDNSLVKVEWRHGLGHVTLGLVLPETTAYVLEVASLTTPTAVSSYTLDVTCETGAKPNLNFTELPAGWSAPVVVSTTRGSNQDAASPMATDTLYLDIVETNRGGAPVTPGYYTDLELDGEIFGTLYNDNMLPNWYVYWTDLPVSMALAPGPHTLTVRIDPNGLLDESDVTDNTFTKSFTLGGTGSQACLADDATLCLDGARFRVRATWFKTDGSSGQAHGVSLTEDTGYFWFFDPTNIEAVVKVLEGCGFNGKRWVFGSGLTNVRVDMTVTDMVTGTVRTYENPLGTAFAPVQDTAAFSCN